MLIVCMLRKRQDIYPFLVVSHDLHKECRAKVPKVPVFVPNEHARLS